MQILPYATGEWDADTLGNHRVVIHAPVTDTPAVQVYIPWRRRDRQAAQKRLILLEAAAGRQITNLLCRQVDREALDLVFQPVSGVEEYFLYFMPYTGSVRAPYPQIEYMPAQESADPAWLANCARPNQVLPQAAARQVQSIDALSSFDPMEVIATEAEVAALLAAHPQPAFFLFPEDRLHPIKMADDLPYRWIEAGPNRPFVGSAAPGEFYVFQVGVYAARAPLQRLTVEFAGAKDAAGQWALPPENWRCFNLGGVDWSGRPFLKELATAQGQVQALWIGVQIPEALSAGEYHTALAVGAAGLAAESVELTLHIQMESIAEYGDSEPERLSRLRWLDSTLALDDEVTAPFTPIEAAQGRFKILGRELAIGADGLPARIESFFAPEMTHLQSQGRPVLAGAVTFTLQDAAGQVLSWQWDEPAHLTRLAAGLAVWQAHGRAGPLRLALHAELEFDGNLEYTLALHAVEAVQLADVRLAVPFQREAARYMLGLGFRGGLRPQAYEWQWDVQRKNQDALWLGDVNAGLQITLKDEHYSRPLNTNFYTLKPLLSPISWDNHGAGRICFAEQGDQSVLVECSSGPRAMAAGETLYYNFRLSLTPYKPIDPGAQWATRYFHRFSPVEEIAAAGANTINIHHANEINPFINYPFLRPQEMKAYIDQAHARDMRVKIYYTVRELTNHAPELFALRSLGDEVLSGGPGGGHSWLREHLVSNYVTGWHVYALKDVAVVNSGASRWHNFYLEGLDWLARHVEIDGLYIDDLAFDRVIMKRVRKILDRRRPGALIDLHSANQFRERDGYANSANLYMEHFPYLNRLWFGEYFDYNLPPDFWLVEVSGIPFGLMGEMLQDGGNPWRGMVYGMTGRMPWSGDPGPLWQAWDELGIQRSRMIGCWSPNCPVRTGRQDVLATVYQQDGQALIALASWASEPVAVTLECDWAALGIEPSQAALNAPAIQNFQPAAAFRPTEAIPLDPGKGWLLRLA